MRLPRLTFLLLAALVACAPPKVPPPMKKAPAQQVEAAQPASSAKAAKAANAKPAPVPKPFVLPSVTLKPEQISDGWIQLFDGESLLGWTAQPSSAWTVRDRAIAAAPDGWLLTHQPFTDFRLRLQFRATGAASATVALRARAADPAASGFVINPAPAKPKPGEWHAYDIYARGSEYIVLLDGRPLLRTRRFSPQAGYLALSGGAIEYRAIHLRPLDLACIFNRKDLNGWRMLQGQEWSVRDGLLHVERGPSVLQSEYAFDDFVFQSDVRLNGAGPAGIYLRGDRDVPGSGYLVRLPEGSLQGLQSARGSNSDRGQWFTLTLNASGRRLAVWRDGVPITVWRDPRPVGLNVGDNRARLLRGTLSLRGDDDTTNVDFRSLCIAPMPRLDDR